MASPENGKKKVPKKTATKLPKEVSLHYQKTPSFRSYHADGLYGGLTPKGKIYCEFFIDRNPTPTTAIHKISNEGYISGKPTSKTGKTGIIRQIECGVIFDIDTAITFKEWLEDKIKQYNETFNLLEKAKK